MESLILKGIAWVVMIAGLFSLCAVVAALAIKVCDTLRAYTYNRKQAARRAAWDAYYKAMGDYARRNERVEVTMTCFTITPDRPADPYMKAVRAEIEGLLREAAE